MHIKPRKEPCKGANPQCTSSLVVRQDAVPSGGNGFYQGAWVTQPPWLHQFRFGWTSAHPITRPGAVTKVESHFFLGPPPPPLSRDFFFHLRTLPAHPIPCSKNKFSPTLLLYLCYEFIFSKLYFILLSLSMLQPCTHPLSSLMFKEELGIATTSRCEQHEVQYFQEDTKTKFVFYKFLCTCGFSTFSIWV
jgi:hypothetical protein